MSLYPHQKEGVDFLKKHVLTKKGCLLGDSCGSGKTIMTIFLFKYLYENRKIQKYFPSIICVPGSVLYKWKEEFETFGFTGSVGVYHGEHRKEMNYHDITITTYETYCRDKFSDIPWKVIILDEGAMIKNCETKRYQEFSKLKTKRRVILSATPVQNSPMELYALFRFLQPGLLGSRHLFKDYFSDPILIGMKNRHSRMYLNRGILRAKILAEKVQPFILRRTFGANRFGKREQTLLVKMSPTQKRVYAKQSIENRKISNPYEQDRQLLAVCNGTHSNCDSFLVSKILALQEIIPTFLENGHKVAIFMKYLATIEKVKSALDQYKPLLVITGATTPKKRQLYLNQFEKENKYKIILLTSRTGGFGINLLQATRIVILSPDYNPSVDNQAAERSNRSGQTKSVCVYRIITEKTIEERIYNRQMDKMCASQLLLNDTTSPPEFEDERPFELLKSTFFTAIDHDLIKKAVCDDFQLVTQKKRFERLQTYEQESVEDRKRKEKRWKKGYARLKIKLKKKLTQKPRSTSKLVEMFKPLFAKYQLDPQALQQRLFKIAELNKNTCKWSLKTLNSAKATPG